MSVERKKSNHRLIYIPETRAQSRQNEVAHLAEYEIPDSHEVREGFFFGQVIILCSNRLV